MTRTQHPILPSSTERQNVTPLHHPAFAEKSKAPSPSQLVVVSFYLFERSQMVTLINASLITITTLFLQNDATLG